MEQDYAEEHKRYLQEHRREFWWQLQKEDADGYLATLGQQAASLFDTLMIQYEQSP